MQIAVQLRVSAHAISPVGVDLDMFNTRNGLDREAAARQWLDWIASIRRPRSQLSVNRSNRFGHRSIDEYSLERAMTYCLAMRLDEGLVFMSDTRTNAGVDNIGTYRKLHVLTPAADRVFVLQSAGNLATTQEVLDRIQVDIDTPGDHESLLSVNRMFEAALYVGRLSHEVNQRYWAALNAVGPDGTATFILGGQIAGLAPDILLVYPEGNYIRASDDRPFLQIGESKFGKFLLEMAVEADAGLVTASKIAIGSMMSTARANLAVGPPDDLAIYPADALTIEEFRILPDSTVLRRLQTIWQRHMLQVVQDMPSVHDLDDLDRRIEQDRNGT